MNQRKAGVVLSYIGMGAQSLVALVYVPLVLHFLTKDQYGVYQLMGSLIMYLSIMDFGLSATTTRYLSQAYAVEDRPRAAKIIATSGALYAAMALILLILGGIFYCFISSLYGKTLSAMDLLLAKQIFLVMLFNMVLAIFSNLFTAVINAHERFIFVRGINLCKVLLYPLVVWGVLAWKASALNLVLAQTGIEISAVCFNYLYCKKALQIRFGWHISDQSLAKELIGFSIFLFLFTLADQTYWQVGQLVLGAFSGPQAVANYAIAMHLAIFMIFLPATMSGVFLPQLSSLACRTKELTEINNIFCKLGRLQFMFMMLLVIGFFFLGKTFIYLWIGPGYEKCFYIAFILMAAYIPDVTQNIGISVLQALNKHAFRACAQLAVAALNILLCIFFSKRFGEFGCAVPTAFCLLLGPGLIGNWHYVRIGLDMKRFFRSIGRICPGIFAAVCIIVLLTYFLPLQTTWISFVVRAVTVTGIYAACIWFFAFNQYEKDLFLVPLRNIGIFKSKNN